MTNANRPLKVAVTIDDFVPWDGVPMAENDSATDVTRSIAATLNDYGLQGTYGFSHTYPLDLDPAGMATFDAWVDAGHHLGNHSHQHAPLRWLTEDGFKADFDFAQKHIGHLVDAAPRAHFRYPIDLSSGSEKLRGSAEQFLAERGFKNAPVTAWFSDFAFIVPHYRALTLGDIETQRYMQELMVSTSVDMLFRHAEAARTLFGTDVPLILVVHGTTIARDSLGAMFEAFLERGVEFITLDEAMRHPLNYAMPPCAEGFVNHLQRFALAGGIHPPELEPERLGEVLGLAPMPGSDTLTIFEEAMLKPMATRVGAEYDWTWS